MTPAFYLTWFFRCYRAGDSGWYLYCFPDGRPIIVQDAFFVQSLEILARTMNVMMLEESRKH